MPLGGEYDGSIAAILEELRLTADLEGLAILDLSRDAAETPVAYCLGAAGAHTTSLGYRLLASSPGEPSHTLDPEMRPLLACPWILPPTRPGGLLMWRAVQGRPWTDNDHDLAASVAMLLRANIGDGLGRPGIDRLTGLPNRRWFLDEADRHIDRLDLDHVVGTLVLIDIDDLRSLNLKLGRPRGDKILVRMANQLRAMVRPSDVVARVGADEFALWQDGMDHLTAAERAESLCARRLFQDLPDGQGISLSIGIVSRLPGSGQDVRTMLRQAHMSAREVKAKGGGGWRVSSSEPLSRCSDSSA